MSRPDPQGGPGETLTLELAAPFGSVTVAPINGAQEMWLAARRGGFLSAAALETLILSAGMLRGGGDDPGAWLVGDRNRLLLAVLCAGYGAPEELWLHCPDCGEIHEVPLDVSALLARVPQGPAGKNVSVEGGAMQIRLPTGDDLCAATAGGAGTLLSRCAPGAGEGAAEVLEAEIAARDPLAEIRVALTCVGCGAAVTGRLDPLTLLVTEIDRGGGVLAEIDRLARVYRWSEAELLALPAWRRRLYLTHLAEAAPSEAARALP